MRRSTLLLTAVVVALLACKKRGAPAPPVDESDPKLIAMIVGNLHNKSRRDLKRTRLMASNTRENAKFNLTLAYSDDIEVEHVVVGKAKGSVIGEPATGLGKPGEYMAATFRCRKMPEACKNPDALGPREQVRIESIENDFGKLLGTCRWYQLQHPQLVGLVARSCYLNGRDRLSVGDYALQRGPDFAWSKAGLED